MAGARTRRQNQTGVAQKGQFTVKDSPADRAISGGERGSLPSYCFYSSHSPEGLTSGLSPSEQAEQKPSVEAGQASTVSRWLHGSFLAVSFLHLPTRRLHRPPSLGLGVVSGFKQQRAWVKVREGEESRVSSRRERETGGLCEGTREVGREGRGHIAESLCLGERRVRGVRRVIWLGEGVGARPDTAINMSTGIPGHTRSPVSRELCSWVATVQRQNGAGCCWRESDNSPVADKARERGSDVHWHQFLTHDTGDNLHHCTSSPNQYACGTWSYLPQ